MSAHQHKQPSVLVVGGGIAGPVAAFWLTRAGFECTIVERAHAPRMTGQQVDVRDAAREIVRRMGIEEAVLASSVHEEGIGFVDSAGKVRAEFLARTDGASFTADLEILRGELARVFYEATRETTTWLMGTRVVALELATGGNAVHATLEGTTTGTRTFDVVIIADGMNSSTRRLVFADDGNPVKVLGQHMGYFTIPIAEHDTSLATWFNAPGGRLIILRPDIARARTGAYLAVCEPASKKSVFAGYERMTAEQQQDIWTRLFDNAGGEAARVVAGMRTADDFYMQVIAQVKAPRWTALGGRVVLVGDSAYCPSPISGLGTSCAIIGAYSLAGELVKAKGTGNWASATAEYERVMRPIAAKAQKLIPGSPGLLNPQTSWGISLLYAFLGAVSWSGVTNWLQGTALNSLVDLPEYDM